MLLQSLVDGSIHHKYGGKAEMKSQTRGKVQVLEVEIKEDPVGDEVEVH